MADSYHFGEQKAENRKRRVVGDSITVKVNSDPNRMPESEAGHEKFENGSIPDGR